MPERSDMPIVLPAPSPQDQAKGGGPERRAQARYAFTAAAEVVDLRSQTRVTGRCSDLSSGGCYVDTISPFGVGTAVRVRLVYDSREFDAAAVVTYAHVSMGMGLAFTGIKREHQDTLRSWLAGLSGARPEELAPSKAAGETESVEPDANMQLVLTELITLLIRKKLITEKEGAGLLHQMFR
jgi:hypothetical protein